MELDACARERSRVSSSFRTLSRAIDANVDKILRDARGMRDLKSETRKSKRRAKDREQQLNDYAKDLLSRSNTLKEENRRDRVRQQRFDVEYGAMKESLKLQIDDLDGFLEPLREKWIEKCKEKVNMGRKLGLLIAMDKVGYESPDVDELEYDDNIHYINYFRRNIRIVKDQLKVLAKKNQILRAKIEGHERRRATIRKVRNELQIRRDMKVAEIRQVKMENERTISKRESQILEASTMDVSLHKEGKHGVTRALKCQKMKERIDYLTKKHAKVTLKTQKAILGMVSKEKVLSTTTVKIMELKRKTREIQDRLFESQDTTTTHTSRFSMMKETYAKVHSELKEVKSELKRVRQELGCGPDMNSEHLISILEQIDRANAESVHLEERSREAQKPIQETETQEYDKKKITSLSHECEEIQRELRDLRVQIDAEKENLARASQTRKKLDTQIMESYDNTFKLTQKRSSSTQSKGQTLLQHKVSELEAALATRKRSLAERQSCLEDQKKLYQFQVSLAVDLSDPQASPAQFCVDNLNRLLSLLHSGRKIFSRKGSLEDWTAAIDHFLERGK